MVDSDQGRMARPRMLPPGQRVDVWLELEMPENHGSSNGDIFQAWSHALPQTRVLGQQLCSAAPCEDRRFSDRRDATKFIKLHAWYKHAAKEELLCTMGRQLLTSLASGLC